MFRPCQYSGASVVRAPLSQKLQHDAIDKQTIGQALYCVFLIHFIIDNIENKTYQMPILYSARQHDTNKSYTIVDRSPMHGNCISLDYDFIYKLEMIFKKAHNIFECTLPRSDNYNFVRFIGIVLGSE